MTSGVSRSFLQCYLKLPREVRRAARKACKTWKHDSNNPGLHFKEVVPKHNIWSVRTGADYRAFGIRDTPDRIVWFLIGTHNDQDTLLNQYQKLSASKIPKAGKQP